MPVPDFQTFFLPLLHLTADGQPHALADLRKAVQADLGLSDEDVREKLPSGTQTKFANRLAWASVYFVKAGVLGRIRRGVFQITELGKRLLREEPKKTTIKTLCRYPGFVEFHKGSAGKLAPAEDTDKESTATPEERLSASYQVLRRAVAADLLETVKKSSPSFFEKLVVDLLVAMGYGGSVEDAGNAVGRSGDGGVDGIIKEDRLGLDVVYVQAKRWTNTVGRPVVQAFAGSLEGHRARKGVLITTSEFSQDALDYVQRIEKRIVLIDGEHLAEYMIDHNVGVTESTTYKVKKIDLDYPNFRTTTDRWGRFSGGFRFTLRFNSFVFSREAFRTPK
jgi:restriction system protein